MRMIHKVNLCFAAIWILLRVLWLSLSNKFQCKYLFDHFILIKILNVSFDENETQKLFFFSLHLLINFNSAIISYKDVRKVRKVYGK